MWWRFRQRLATFMYGRYGVDKLYWALFWTWLVLSVINVFAASFVIYLLELLLIVIMYFRAFSRNIYKRRMENERYLKTVRTVKDFFKLQFSRVKDIGKKRYRRCPSCRAVLRLPIKRGKRTAKCPACQRNFTVRIII